MAPRKIAPAQRAGRRHWSDFSGTPPTTPAAVPATTERHADPLESLVPLRLGIARIGLPVALGQLGDRLQHEGARVGHDDVERADDLPGHDASVPGDEPAILVEFDFQAETAHRFGLVAGS